MIVVDASAMTDLLADTNHADAVVRQLQHAESVAAPELLIIEVTSALWRLVRAGSLTPSAAGRAVQRLIRMPVSLMGHRTLAAHAWRRRESVRIADAYYLACAELLGAPLLTTDRRLARGPHDGVLITAVS